MQSLSRRFAITPYIVLGSAMVILGSLAINHIADNFWPIDTQRLDLVRNIAIDRSDSTELLPAANFEIIATFFAAELMTIAGLVMPLAYFLNKRFGNNESRPMLTILRQAMWVGIWAIFCTWLQMNRSLNWGVALLVATVFLIFEVLLQIRSRAALIDASSRD